MQCYPDYGAGRCPGATNSNCYPYIVASSKQVSDTHAWSPELNGGKFFEYNGDAGHAKMYATGVRCVLDLEAQNKLKILAMCAALTNCRLLCDQQSGYGTLQCRWGSGSCPGATSGSGGAGTCYPYVIWSSKQVGEDNAWAAELAGVKFYAYFGEAGHARTWAFSVRCVPDLGEISI